MASRLQDVILRDTRANQPLATAVAPGTLYFVTDETVTERSNGTAWETYSGASSPAPATNTFLTETNETASLPNSRRVLAGTGISFDDTVPNVRTINATGSLASATVTLTDADIKALPTTPILLVAAPSAGNQIKCIAATISADCSAGAYTNINATYAAMYLTHDTASNWPLMGVVDDVTVTLTRLTALLNTSPLVVNLPPYSDGVDAGAFAGALEWNVPPSFPVAQVDGKAINIYIDNNGSGNLTGGNAANTIKVTLYYVTEAL